MKGDFSRLTFDPKKHYRNVLMQQGRVSVDADFNEQQFIASHRIETESVDTIGKTGAPYEDEKNFAIKCSGKSITIKSGHYYVNGILCENESDCTIGYNDNVLETDQPDPPGSMIRSDSTPAGRAQLSPPQYLVYLDVWQKHLTYLDDDTIREKALGGVDTSTRLKTVWQVKLLETRNISQYTDEETINNYLRTQFENPSQQGKMTPEIVLTEIEQDLCNSIFLKPETRWPVNQLYRVEIHDVVSSTQLWLKCSSNNGELVSTCSYSSKNDGIYTFRINQVRADTSSGLEVGQIVELTSPVNENDQTCGFLAEVVSVNIQGAMPTVDVRFIIAHNQSEPTVDQINKFTKIRCWDNQEIVSFDQGINVNNGLKLKFSAGRYRSGDYWLIPIRSFEPYIDWPKSGDVFIGQFPHGVQHNYCCLAIVEYDNADGWNLIKDFRKLFPSLTDLTSLFYISGDGQQVNANSSERQLEFPLRVGVANGRYPVKNAVVKFTIRPTGSPAIQPTDWTLSADKIDWEKELITQTDNNGIAECWWRLGTKPDSQQVEARLADQSSIPVRFTGYLKSHSEDDAVMRVVGVMSRTQRVDNDTKIDLDDFINGIQIVLDHDVYQSSVRNKPVCFLTLYQPLFLKPEEPLTLYGYQPLILALQLNSDNSVIYLNFDNNVKTWLTTKLLESIWFQHDKGILVWLTLKGNFIWSENSTTDSKLYLDGEVYGTHILSKPNIDAEYTGNGKSGGDFQMWFWLTPPSVKISSINVSTVSQPAGRIAGVATIFDPIQSSGSTLRLSYDGTPRNVITRFVIEFTGPIDKDSFSVSRSILFINRAVPSASAPTMSEPEVSDSNKIISFEIKNRLPPGEYNITLSKASSPITSQDVPIKEFSFTLMVN